MQQFYPTLEYFFTFFISIDNFVHISSSSSIKFPPPKQTISKFFLISFNLENDF